MKRNLIKLSHLGSSMSCAIRSSVFSHDRWWKRGLTNRKSSCGWEKHVPLIRRGPLTIGRSSRLSKRKALGTSNLPDVCFGTEEEQYYNMKIALRINYISILKYIASKYVFICIPFIPFHSFRFYSFSFMCSYFFSKNILIKSQT